jgi:hypothetical protein
LAILLKRKEKNIRKSLGNVEKNGTTNLSLMFFVEFILPALDVEPILGSFFRQIEQIQ